MCQFGSEGTVLLRTAVIYHREHRPSLVPRFFSVTKTPPYETKMTIFWQILLLYIGIGTVIEREYRTKGQHVRQCKLSNASLSRGLCAVKTLNVPWAPSRMICLFHHLYFFLTCNILSVQHRSCRILLPLKPIVQGFYCLVKMGYGLVRCSRASSCPPPPRPSIVVTVNIKIPLLSEVITFVALYHWYVWYLIYVTVFSKLELDRMVTDPLNDFASLDWGKFWCIMYLSHSPLEAKDFQFKSTRRFLSAHRQASPFPFIATSYSDCRLWIGLHFMGFI